MSINGFRFLNKAASFLVAVLVMPLFYLSAQNADVPKREFRGAWLHVIGQTQWMNKTAGQQRVYIADLLDKLQQAGCNAVIFQVRPSADAMYQSTLEPWTSWMAGKRGKAPNEPDWDPLQYFIEQAHARGMELHAWLNPYRVVSNPKETLPPIILQTSIPRDFSNITVKLFLTPPIRKTEIGYAP